MDVKKSPKHKRPISELRNAPSPAGSNEGSLKKKKIVPSKPKIPESPLQPDTIPITPKLVKMKKVKRIQVTTTTVVGAVQQSSLVPKAKAATPKVAVLSDSEAEEFDLLLQNTPDLESELKLPGSDSESGLTPSTSTKRHKKVASALAVTTPVASTPSSNASNEIMDPSTLVVETRTINGSQDYDIGRDQSLCIRGIALVKVQHGKVIVNGFELSPKSEAVELFSENIHALQTIRSVEGASTVNLAVDTRNILKDAPDASSNGVSSEYHVLKFSEEAQKLASQPYSKPVLLCGARNTGKSTFARYLVNVLLNRYDTVAFLECDVGQSEFTPPGLVSLTLVDTPMLGPPHTHQRTPVCAFFVGANTSSAHPRLYVQSIKQCYDHYCRFLSSASVTSGGVAVPLIVNTQGWVTGLGLDLLQQTVRYLRPHVVELRNQAEPLDFPGSTVLQVHSRRNTASTAAHARNMAFMSYFLPHVSCPLLDVGQLLVGEKPVQLERKRIWFHALFGELTEPLETFAGMLVGLCCVPQLPDPPVSSALSSVLTHLPEGAICVGLALVRAITHDSLFLLTPANVDHVNVLVKGDLSLPPSFYHSEASLYLTSINSVAGAGNVMASRRNVRRSSGT